MSLMLSFLSAVRINQEIVHIRSAHGDWRGGGGGGGGEVTVHPQIFSSEYIYNF